MLTEDTCQLNVVMAAGERHAKNYHAWQYARQVWRLLSDEKIREEGENKEEEGPYNTNTSQESLAAVHQWCLMHPRDISGWAFLVFWLRSAFNEATRLQEAQKVIGKTEEFVNKFDWQGESVEWFLKTMLGLYPLG